MVFKSKVEKNNMIGIFFKKFYFYILVVRSEPMLSTT